MTWSHHVLISLKSRVGAEISATKCPEIAEKLYPDGLSRPHINIGLWWYDGCFTQILSTTSDCRYIVVNIAVKMVRWCMCCVQPGPPLLPVARVWGMLPAVTIFILAKQWLENIRTVSPRPLPPQLSAAATRQSFYSLASGRRMRSAAHGWHTGASLKHS